MKKKRSLIIGIVVLMVLGYGIFYSHVHFEYVYDGVISLSDMAPVDYKDFIKKDSYIFHSREEFENFKDKFHINNGQIPDISFEHEPLLLTRTHISIEKGGTLYSVEKINKNLFVLDITLKQKGFVTLKGFDENSNPQNITICKIKPGIFTKMYKPHVKVK